MFYDITRDELIDAIIEGSISPYDITKLSSDMLLDKKVLLTFLSENTIPLEFVLQNPVVRKEAELNKGIHQSVMLSRSELKNLWFNLESAANRDFNVILEAIANVWGTIRNDYDYDKLWIVYGLYPGVKQIKQLFGDNIPTSEDIERESSNILDGKYANTTVRRKLEKLQDKAYKINKANSIAIDAFAAEMLAKEKNGYYIDEYEDVNPFMRTRKRK